MQRQHRVLQEAQREIAGQPLQIGIVAALGQLVGGGQLVRKLRIPVPHLRPCERAAVVGPFVRKAETAWYQALFQQKLLGIIGQPLLHTPVEAVIGEPRIGLELFRHRGHQSFDLLRLAPQAEPRASEESVVVIDQLQHAEGVALASVPDRLRQPRGVVRRQNLDVAGAEPVVCFRIQIERPPREHDGRLGLPRLAGIFQRPGIAQRAVARRGRMVGVKRQHLRIACVGHGGFAARHQIGQPGPVGVVLEKAHDLLRAALSGAKLGPSDDVSGNRPVAFGQRQRLVPLPVPGGRHGRGQGARRHPLQRGRLGPQAASGHAEQPGQPDGQGKLPGAHYCLHFLIRTRIDTGRF